MLQPFLQFYQALEENKDRVRSIKEQIRDFKNQNARAHHHAASSSLGGGAGGS
jgi:hypothetical protein